MDTIRARLMPERPSLRFIVRPGAVQHQNGASGGCHGASNAHICGVRVRISGESTQGAFFVCGDDGLALTHQFNLFLAHFAVTPAVEQQQSQQGEQHAQAIGQPMRTKGDSGQRRQNTKREQHHQRPYPLRPPARNHEIALHDAPRQREATQEGILEVIVQRQAWEITVDNQRHRKHQGKHGRENRAHEDRKIVRQKTTNAGQLIHRSFPHTTPRQWCAHSPKAHCR